MSLVITRKINEMPEERLPGDYGEIHAAEQALEKVLKELQEQGYKHGENAEQAYWWARSDKDGQQLKFYIKGI